MRLNSTLVFGGGKVLRDFSVSVSDGRRASIGDGDRRSRETRTRTLDPKRSRPPPVLGGAQSESQSAALAFSATVDHAKDPHRDMRVLF